MTIRTFFVALCLCALVALAPSAFAAEDSDGDGFSISAIVETVLGHIGLHIDPTGSECDSEDCEDSGDGGD